MKKSINSNGSETGTEGSEPIDLTRIAYSSESMSDKDFHIDNQLKKEEVTVKKSRFKGKNKIDIEFITKKSRRQSTFSKRKTGLMKKAYELAELTGAEVLLMIASDTNHVYTYGTTKMKPVFESEQGKLLIEACLNSNVEGKASENNQNAPELTNPELFNNTLQSSQSNNNHIGQLVFNVDNSVCRDSKLFPISISNGNAVKTQNLISSNLLFPASNKIGSKFGCSDNIVISNNKSPDGAVLVSVSLDSISSVVPKNN